MVQATRRCRPHLRSGDGASQVTSNRVFLQFLPATPTLAAPSFPVQQPQCVTFYGRCDGAESEMTLAKLVEVCRENHLPISPLAVTRLELNHQLFSRIGECIAEYR